MDGPTSPADEAPLRKGNTMERFGIVVVGGGWLPTGSGVDTDAIAKFDIATPASILDGGISQVVGAYSLERTETLSILHKNVLWCKSTPHPSPKVFLQKSENCPTKYPKNIVYYWAADRLTSRTRTAKPIVYVIVGACRTLRQARSRTTTLRGTSMMSDATCRVNEPLGTAFENPVDTNGRF